MVAQFRELFANQGVDDDVIPPMMIVPLNGANLVALTDGQGLRLDVNPTTTVKITEVDPKYVQALIAQNQLMASVKTGAKLLPKDARIFEIRGKTLGGGSRGTAVKALDARRVLKANVIVAVLKQRKVKIAVREVQVRDDSGGIVFHAGRRFDIPKLVGDMNWIWSSQGGLSR
jgi:hypothetical protein